MLECCKTSTKVSTRSFYGLRSYEFLDVAGWVQKSKWALPDSVFRPYCGPLETWTEREWTKLKLMQAINVPLFLFLRPFRGIGQGKGAIRPTDFEATQEHFKHYRKSKFLSRNYGSSAALKQKFTFFLTFTKASCETLLNFLCKRSVCKVKGDTELFNM